MKRNLLILLILIGILALPCAAGAAVSAGSTMTIGTVTGIDITQDQSDADGKWEWDAANATLTIRQGVATPIVIQCSSTDSVTLLYEGDVDLKPINTQSIVCYGNFTVNRAPHTPRGILTIDCKIVNGRYGVFVCNGVDLIFAGGNYNLSSNVSINANESGGIISAAMANIRILGDTSITTFLTGEHMGSIGGRNIFINTIGTLNLVAEGNCCVLEASSSIEIWNGNIELYPKTSGNEYRTSATLTHQGGNFNGNRKPPYVPPAQPAPPAHDIVIAPSTNEGGNTTLTNNGGNTYTAAADPVDGWAFSHWEDENGNVVSTQPSYTFTADGDRKLIAVFEENAQGVENTYPEIISGTVRPNIQGGTAHVFLNEQTAKAMAARIPKAAAEGRIARLTLDTKSADSLRLRLSPAALNLLITAKVDALELRSDAGEIYMDAKALSAAYKASSAQNQTFQLLVQPKGDHITIQADLYKGAALTSLEGQITVRLPWDVYASANGQPSYFDSRNELLVVSPNAFGSFTTSPLVGNLSWAADYIYYALQNKLMASSIEADKPYTDAGGKTYTRTTFAAKLYGEAQKDGVSLKPLRARFPFTDNASKAAVALQQAGVISPLSDGTFGGNRTITNAEAAAWLARLDWLKIDPLSPYRWVVTDDGAGKLFYAYHGGTIVGKQTIDGTAYNFGANGIAQ